MCTSLAQIRLSMNSSIVFRVTGNSCEHEGQLLTCIRPHKFQRSSRLVLIRSKGTTGHLGSSSGNKMVSANSSFQPSFLVPQPRMLLPPLTRTF